MIHENVPVITLDGPSGTGKGTISQMLANELSWHYLDSGAIYRVFALSVQQQQIEPDDIPKLIDTARQLELEFKVHENKSAEVYLNQKNVSAEIREEACGQLASKLASIQEVRLALLDRQRHFAKKPGLVTDGRDMGTVVFPDAPLKIYLDASPEERALRRFKQLKEKNIDVTLSQVVDELNTRDSRDKQRAHSPLAPAIDAKIIDTTSMKIVQVFNSVLNLVKRKSFDV